MDVDRHVATFNAAVTTGEWGDFVEMFADDATLDFVGPAASPPVSPAIDSVIDSPAGPPASPPVSPAIGPFVGREAIAVAYAQMPPDDTIVRVGDRSVVGDETVVRYRWSATGEHGTMRIRETADGRIARLVVSFG